MTAVDRKATRQALAALEQRFPWPRYVTAREVWSGDKAESRFVDFVVVNLKAYELHAFEVKASRQDWLKELECGFVKSAWIRGRVDFFSVVAARAGIVESTELPPNVGLYVFDEGEGLVQVVAPQRLGGVLDTALLVGILRRVARGGLGVDHDFQLERERVRVRKLRGELGRARREAWRLKWEAKG